jgi:hypothetical protein
MAGIMIKAVMGLGRRSAHRKTGGRSFTVKVAQRPRGSGVPPRRDRARSRSVRGHRGTASRRDAAPTETIHPVFGSSHRIETR